MGQDLQYVFDNNTISLLAIEKTLNSIKQNSYNNLYGIQLNSKSYKRFNLKMSDLKLMDINKKRTSIYPNKYIGFIPESFISDKNTLLFKRSQFFNKELTIFDVASNSHIFHKTYMVFVDGKLFDTINLFCKGDVTYVIFDIAETINVSGIPKDYFKELMDKNADISVIFILNCGYGIYNTNINVLKKYSNELSLDRFNIVNSLDSETNYITFVNSNSLLFNSVITDSTNSTELLRFYDNTFNDIDHKLIHINIFGFRNMLDQLDIVGTEKYFQMAITDMPIPIENIMIFRNIDGKKYFAHDIELRLFYPNIYEIINNINNDDLTMYIFYSDDSSIVAEKYYNDLELYYQYTTNILDMYKNNSILALLI